MHIGLVNCSLGLIKAIYDQLCLAEEGKNPRSLFFSSKGLTIVEVHVTFPNLLKVSLILYLIHQTCISSMYIRTISDHVISLFSVGLNSLHVVQFTMVHVHVVVHAVYTDCGV